MDPIRFEQACKAATGSRVNGTGIGTLGEKTLHAVLKRYIDPNQQNHEAKIGPYVADIVGQDGIVEIQTQGFDKLRKKLTAFLDVTTVTVVYPIAQTKWLTWIDPETGELSARRKSPKRGSFYSAFYELYKIKPLLPHPNLRLHLVLLELEEYRSLNGWSYDRKRGSSRYERIPTALAGECRVDTPADYMQFVPDSLPQAFTTKDYAAATRLRLDDAQTALNVLRHVRAVHRTGTKQGRLYLHARGPAP